MSLFITSINSGSNGNCYYVGNASEAVLIDAGVGCKETERRMNNLGLGMHRVKAIFISHEHTDHIKGVAVLAKRYKLPVYISENTYRRCNLQLASAQVYFFGQFEVIKIGLLSITAFPKLHDASDPHSFTVSCEGTTVGVFTDIGKPCPSLTFYFKQCHAAFLEANYDETMLENGPYPIYLKNRIRGGYGHLSNRQALEFFLANRPPFMSHLILSHLSRENNCPQALEHLFLQHALSTKIIIAGRYKETELYSVAAAPAVKSIVASRRQLPVQASLFD